jgi:hypothetical protein
MPLPGHLTTLPLTSACGSAAPTREEDSPVNTQQLPKMREVTSMSGFRTSGFREYNSQYQRTTIPEIAKGDQHFKISEFEISRIQWLTLTHNNSRNSEKRPAFQDFRVWNFASTMTNINTQQLPESRKENNILGFQSSEFCKYRSQTSTDTNL